MAAIRTMKRFDKQKEPAALIFSKAAASNGRVDRLLYDGFFLLPSCGRLDRLFSFFLFIIKRFFQNILMNTFLQPIRVR